MKSVKTILLAAIMFGAVAPVHADFYQNVGNKLAALSKNLKEMIPAFAGAAAGYTLGYVLKKRALAKAFEHDKKILREIRRVTLNDGGLNASDYIKNKMVIADEAEKTALLEAVDAHNSLVYAAGVKVDATDEQIKQRTKYLTDQIDGLLAKEPKVKLTQVSDWWLIGGGTIGILAELAYRMHAQRTH